MGDKSADKSANLLSGDSGPTNMLVSDTTGDISGDSRPTVDTIQVIDTTGDNRGDRAGDTAATSGDILSGAGADSRRRAVDTVADTTDVTVSGDIAVIGVLETQSSQLSAVSSYTERETDIGYCRLYSLRRHF